MSAYGLLCAGVCLLGIDCDLEGKGSGLSVLCLIVGFLGVARDTLWHRNRR